MKKTISIEQDTCDICEEESAHKKCLGCGKLVCYDCRKEGRAKEYAQSVYFSSSDDGVYCLDCDKRLAAAGDQLHASYRVIRHMRDELDGWSADFKARQDKAEARIKELRQQVNGDGKHG